MHILMIPSWFPNEKHPQNGIYFKEQAETLVNKNIKVTIVYANFISFNPFDFFRYKDNRLSIVEKYENGITSYGFPKFQYKKAYLYYYYLKKIFKRIIKENGYPDIIHAHSSIWAGFYATKLGKEFNIPVIVTEHASMFRFESILNKYKNELQFIFQNVKKFVVVGPSLFEIFKKFLDEDKLIMIPNMVRYNDKNTNMACFKKNSNKKNYYQKKENDFIFFSLGALRKVKGFDILIKAFFKAFYNTKDSDKNNKNNEFNYNSDLKSYKNNDYIYKKIPILIIGGDGKEKSYIKKLIKSLNLDKKIILTGQLDREEVNYYMEICDVFILTSRYETFGISYIEALYHGKPVIATKCGGPEIIVDKYNGILVEVDNINQIANSMRDIKNNINRFDKNIIKKRCIKKFGEESFVNQYLKLYKQIINDN